jgi:hypothetical protein
MSRAAEIVELRALGLSLAAAARVLDGDVQTIERALATHQTIIENRVCELNSIIARVRRRRTDLSRGEAPVARGLVGPLEPTSENVAFDLPWPWGGERFELRDIRPLNYIVGPLGSGKTRFARCLADALPGAAFVSLDRLKDGCGVARAGLNDDPTLRSRVNESLAALIEDGGSESPALLALLAALQSDGPTILVIDMLEEGLETATQKALIASLRSRRPNARTLFLLTRSSAILDMNSVGSDEAIILCPANHDVPSHVSPYPGSPGYEAVATCLASPDVRARTQGVIAYRSHNWSTGQ